MLLTVDLWNTVWFSIIYFPVLPQNKLYAIPSTMDEIDFNQRSAKSKSEYTFLIVSSKYYQPRQVAEIGCSHEMKNEVS